MPGAKPPPSNRAVGFLFVAVLVIAAAWLAWTGRGGALVCAGAAALLCVVALARPSLLAPLNRAWMRLGALLHRIVSPLALGIVYFALVTPYALVMRLARRDALRLRFEPAARTYWLTRDPPGPRPDSLRQQY